jgi:hypothetical protein
VFSLFGWLVADGWCWFVLREEYCWLVAGGWFVVREKYCWLMADKPSEQGGWRATASTEVCKRFFRWRDPVDQFASQILGQCTSSLVLLVCKIPSKLKISKCDMEDYFDKLLAAMHFWST